MFIILVIEILVILYYDANIIKIKKIKPKGKWIVSDSVMQNILANSQADFKIYEHFINYLELLGSYFFSQIIQSNIDYSMY